MSALVRAFWDEAAASEAALRVTYDTAEMPAVLAALYARGRGAHPDLAVSEALFGRCLARAIGGEPFQRPAAVAAEDLYLACACAGGVRGGAAAFERRFAKTVRRAVSRVLATADQREEAEQRVRQQLLVAGPDRPPRIAEYRGRGPLEAWISVAAIRVASAFGRSESALRRLEAKALGEATGADPERLFIKEEIRREINAAAAEAVRRLSARERLVLRFFLVSGMSVTAIGKALGISQPAVSKLIGRARDSIRANVPEALKQRLRVSDAELASIIGVVMSRLDVSIARALGESG